MAGNIEQLVDELERSYQEAQERMSDPAVYNDHREAAAAGRRLKELEGPHKLALEWRQVHADLAEARVDGVLRELVPELEERGSALEEELRVALAPTDPADSKDVIVEIRGGAGGDEAAIFAGDLFRMYARYAERRGWKVEVESSSPGEHGGYKEIVARIDGRGAFSRLKFESGTHRVQRVPETESQGRIHTSTATVAVMNKRRTGNTLQIAIRNQDRHERRLSESSSLPQQLNRQRSPDTAASEETGCKVQT